MATVVKNNVVKNIGTTFTSIANTNQLARYTIIGLSFTNLINSFVYLDVTLDGGYYIKDLILPPGGSLRAVSTGEKLVMGFANNLQAKASEDNAVDAIVSYAEITSQVDETILFFGEQNVTTTVDVDGNIIIVGPDLTPYAQTENMKFYLAADDSVAREVYMQNTIQFVGSNGITTTSDVDGVLTISGPNLSNYITTTQLATYGFLTAADFSDYAYKSDIKFSVAGDDSTQRVINADETIKFIGASNITTAADAEGNITITGPDLSSFLTASDLTGYVTSTALTTTLNDYATVNNLSNYATISSLSTYAQKTDIVFRITGDDSTIRSITPDESIVIVGGTGITTSSDVEGNITINNDLGNVVINTASNGEVLTYSNGNWINQAAGVTPGSLDPIVAAIALG